MNQQYGRGSDMARDPNGIQITGEVWRWLFGLVCVGMIAWFTANETTQKQIVAVRADTVDRIQAVDERAKSTEDKEQDHFEEIQRTLNRMDEARKQEMTMTQQALTSIDAELVRLRAASK